jgi:hypothetical protein
MPFSSAVTDEEEVESEPSTLDEIFASLEFDISIAKTCLINIELVDKILNLIVSNLTRLEPASLVSFCKEAIERKGKDSAKRAAMFIVLLMEISSGNAVFSHASSNMRCAKGVRVERVDGSRRVWTITKVSFEENRIPILAAIVARIETEFAKQIATILTGKDILKGLTDVRFGNVASQSSYFVLREDVTPSANGGSSSSFYSNFKYQEFSKEGEAVGDVRKIRWLCSKDQKDQICLLMKTLGESGLRGEILDTCSLEYVFTLCNVLHTCVDPFRLNARIDSINGARAEEEGDDEAEEGVDEAVGETQREGSEPLLPFEIRRILVQEIDGQRDPIRYNFAQKAQNPKKTTRERNGLAAMAKVCTILSDKLNWLKPQGDHFNAEYARFFSTKHGTEVKSYLTNGNPLYRYPSILLTF